MSPMHFICNDVLTRVRPPVWGKSWSVPRTYRVGDVSERNGMSYRILGFKGVKQTDRPRCVWAIIRYRGERNRDSILIGDTESFQEKLVFGSVV